MLRERGWVTIPRSGPLTIHDHQGARLLGLVQSRSGVLWALDTWGAVLRREGSSWRPADAAKVRNFTSPNGRCALLAATQRDGGPSLPHDLPHVDVVEGHTLFRCTARGPEILWRGSRDTKVIHQGDFIPLEKLLDGLSLRLLAAGSLSDGAALVVDGSGALIRVTSDGRAECIRAGTAYRYYRHDYGDNEPDEHTSVAYAAAVAPDGSAWMYRYGRETLQNASARDLREFSIERPVYLSELTVAPDGTLWGLGPSYLQSFVGPRAGVHIALDPPFIEALVGPDAWLVDDCGHRTVMRTDGDSGVTERVAGTDEPSVHHDTTCVHDGVRWRADWKHLCVLTEDGPITVAEAHDQIVALVPDSVALWVLTETSVARWNGAALIDFGGPDCLSDLAIHGATLLAISHVTAFTATAPPLDPAISLDSPRDLVILSRLLNQAFCPLSVVARRVSPREPSAGALAEALSLPGLRGDWRRVPPPVAGDAINRLWAGDSSSPGLDDDIRVRLAGCFVRAGDRDAVWFVREGPKRVFAVMAETRGFGLATFRVPHVSTDTGETEDGDGEGEPV